MPDLVIRVDPERRDWWKETLSSLLPGYSVFLWDEDAHQYDQDAIDYAVVWMPPLGGLAQLTNLRCVFSVGAGVQHILRDPDYPRHVPIVRTISQDLRMRMCEYVALHVLRYHRRLPDIEMAHASGEWKQYVEPLARDVPVGLLGLGNLGSACAKVLRSIGYTILGWSRRGRPLDGVTVFQGEDGLAEVLSRSKVIVSLLPGTDATSNLLDKRRLQTMPAGAYLINVGRGETVVDADLLDVLGAGHLGGATLDVFREEPLPSDHPYWTTPNILVTSHTASAIEPATGGRVIAQNVKAFDAGEPVPDMIDMKQGY